MILVAGGVADKVTELVCARLDACGYPYRLFDLGRYPKGSSKAWTFERRGPVQVFCHIHSDMCAVVLVLPNPFFAVPDDDHRFVIDGVPEGDYSVVGWHERATRVVHKIHVTAGQTTIVDFNIPLPPPEKRAPPP